MKILILHRIPYHKVDYHRGIDHETHDVIYLGDATALKQIPEDLRCQKVERKEPTFESCLASLKERRHFEFDRIVSLSEYELLLAASLREYFGTPGPKVEEVLLVRDKVQMKKAVEASGVRVPCHIRASSLGVHEDFPWEGATVLKPVDGASSEGVQVFPSLKDALNALQKTPLKNPADWELEEFVEGGILHFDGLVVDGSIAALVPSRYVGNCLAYAQGSPLGSVQIPLDSINEPQGAREWVEKCLHAVRIKNGTFHLEAIETKKSLVFLEVGARVGGADVVPCFELATGLHLPSAELALLSGAPLPNFRPPEGYFSWFVYPGHMSLSGESSSMRVSGTEKFAMDPRVLKWHERVVTAAPEGRISYQALESPLAGILGASFHGDLEDFLRDLFHSCKMAPVLQSV